MRTKENPEPIFAFICSSLDKDRNTTFGLGFGMLCIPQSIFSILFSKYTILLYLEASCYLLVSTMYINRYHKNRTLLWSFTTDRRLKRSKEQWYGVMGYI
ncbi:MAG: hypothetical protein EOP45_03670 [Sphingobacteriaceae bacterium]|nr:MAG: hypothetical protein EOP45_03670 [Sphingobacteriaceae bacterium]